jgi:hypothetical protein
MQSILAVIFEIAEVELIVLECTTANGVDRIDVILIERTVS